MLGSRVHASLAVRRIDRCACFSSTKSRMLHSVYREACSWHSPQLLLNFLLTSTEQHNMTCKSLHSEGSGTGKNANTAQVQVSSHCRHCKEDTRHILVALT